MSNRFRPAAPARAALVSSLAIAVSLSAARAQEVLEISDERTDETFSTSTAVNGAAGDITLLPAGVLNLEDVTLGPVITLDTDNQVLIEGDINIGDGDDAIAIAIRGAGGANAGFTNEGAIVLAEPEDPDTTDDETPPLFSNRVGVDIGLTGETFTGDILFRPNDTISSLINVFGDQSYAVVLRGDLVGDIIQARGASMRIFGEDSVGLAVFGDVTGDITYGGVLDADGVNTAGVLIDGVVNGAFTVNGSISSTGYESTVRLSETLDDEEQAAENAASNAEQALRQGGSAVAIRSSISGGFLLNGPNAEDEADGDGVDRRFEIDETGAGEDTDGDGVGDDPDGLDDRDIADVPDEELEVTLDSAVSTFGSAPAIHISQLAYQNGLNAAGDDVLGTATGDIVLGLVGTGPDAYGAIFRGTVAAAGIFDGVDATAVAIEGGGGGRVIVENGILFENSISASAREADSTSVRIGADAVVPRIDIIDLGSAFTSTVVALQQNEHDAVALLIAEGASVNEVENQGGLFASAAGSGVNAYAFRDLSGTVTSFINRGRLEVSQTASFEDADDDGTVSEDEFFDFVGVGVAADFSANTTGVSFLNELRSTINVGSSASLASARVVGDVLFGSGSDTFTMRNGVLIGARGLPSTVDFGDGDDTFLFDPRTDGGDFDPNELGNVVASLQFGSGDDAFIMRNGFFNGAITSTDGVSIDVTGGEFRLINLSVLDALGGSGDLGIVLANDVFIGSEVDYRFQVDNSRDVADGQAVRIQASDAITIEAGASVTPIFVGDLPETAVFDVFSSDISIDFQGADPNDLLIDGVTPFLYDITYSLEDLNGSDGVNDTLRATFRRKEASETGIFAGQFAAYDVLIESIQLDEEIRDTAGDITTQADFVKFFNQLIPDYSDSVIAYQTAIVEGSRRGVAGRASAVERDTQGAWSFWADEFTFFLSQDQNGDQQGYAGGGFGLSFGADKPVGPLDAVGFMFSYASPSVDLKSADATRMSFTSYEFGPYVATKIGSVAFDLTATYGLIDYDTTRTIALNDIRRTAESDGSGSFFSAGARASYEKAYGNYYVRPEAQFSYVDLTQDAFSEGGFDIGDGVALQIGERDFTSARAILETTVGRRKPNRYGYMDLEARLGVRNEFITDAPEAVVTPQGFAESFTLTGAERSDIAVRGGLGASFVSGVFSQVDLTYDTEFADQEMRHEFRIIGRIRF